MAALLVALRLHTHREPLERDLTTYAYVAHRLLAGDALYEDVWDHKPPAIYAVYAASELVFGYEQGAVTALGIVTGVATLAALFVFLRRISGRLAAWTGAGVLVAVSSSTALQANQPNVEAFLNPLIVAALAAYALGSRVNAGIALAAATLFKPNAIFFAIPLVWPRTGEPPRFRSVLEILGPSLVAWFATAGYFAGVGRFEAFLDAVFRYNMAYSEGVQLVFLRVASEPALLFPVGIREIAAPTAAALAWTAWNRSPRSRLTVGFFRLFLVATLLSIVSPGHLHPHYFQLAIPLVAIGSALAVADVGTLLATRSSRLAAGAIAAVVSVVFADLAPEIVRDLRRTPREISIAKYGPIFADAADVARIVAGLTEPGDAVYEWGSETGIYYYSKRRCASSLSYVHPLRVGDEEDQRERRQRLKREVESVVPAIFVWAQIYGPPEASMFGPFLARNYRRIGSFGFYVLYRRSSRVEEPANLQTSNRSSASVRQDQGR